MIQDGSWGEDEAGATRMVETVDAFADVKEGGWEG